MRPSMRASEKPTHRCGPPAKARCLLGLREISSLSGWAPVHRRQSLADRRIHALPRLDRVRQGQADEDADRRDDERISQRLHADSPDAPEVAQPRHADHEAGENQRDDEQQEQTQKQLTDRIGEVVDDRRQPRIASRKDAVQNAAGRRARDQAHQDASMQRYSANELQHRPAWYTGSRVSPPAVFAQQRVRVR